MPTMFVYTFFFILDLLSDLILSYDFDFELEEWELELEWSVPYLFFKFLIKLGIFYNFFCNNIDGDIIATFSSLVLG